MVTFTLRCFSSLMSPHQSCLSSCASASLLSVYACHQCSCSIALPALVPFVLRFLSHPPLALADACLRFCLSRSFIVGSIIVLLLSRKLLLPSFFLLPIFFFSFSSFVALHYTAQGSVVSDSSVSFAFIYFRHNQCSLASWSIVRTPASSLVSFACSTLSSLVHCPDSLSSSLRRLQPRLIHHFDKSSAETISKLHTIIRSEKKLINLGGLIIKALFEVQHQRKLPSLGSEDGGSRPKF